MQLSTCTESSGPDSSNPRVKPGLEFALARSSIAFQRQVGLPITYQGFRLECGYPVDFVVEDRVIVEVKSADTIAPIHALS